DVYKGQAMAEHAAQLTAIMLRPLPDSYALRGLLRDDRISALCLGPGLGIQRAADMVPAALWGARPTVLDADALTAFAEDPERIFTQIHQDVVLTPHPGEFSRLFPDIAEAALGETPHLSLQAATQTAAERAGCVVLLKGPRTHIATPDGQSAYHDATGDMAAPWLATAGSGDVLAGLITGLMARGMAPFEAACTATWLHAATARSFGPGLIAEDLPEHLPRLLREIGVT
ncbi:NAD(P)H-hydrate dehydratase, partial [Thioclava sp. BHET1]